MELVQLTIGPSVKFLNTAREGLLTMLARTRWLGNPLQLPPHRVVSAMSDRWLRDFESHDRTHLNDR